MQFNSPEFIAFFCLITGLYFVAPFRARWLILLLASCFFYMTYVPQYILIMFALILVDYLAAFAIAGAQGTKRTAWLWVSLGSNLAALGFFKYYNFANENIDAVSHWFGGATPLPFLKLLLPVGLSFHVFQSMSYTIEVYYGKQKPERHLGLYALYVLFYPQLVAGPIERPQHLLPQLKKEHSFDPVRVREGLLLMLGGLLKKIVIADRAAMVVNHVYEHGGQYGGATLVLATYLFGFQVYCDFSGYSDIARGAGRVMGIELVPNFNFPYAAASISAFWRKWHMSLLNWFRDYIYMPIAFSGSRSVKRAYVAIGVVFFVSGVWHGAAWTYILFGCLHGFYSIFAMVTTKWRTRVAKLTGLAAHPRLHSAFKVFVVFHLVTFSWIIFRAPSIRAAGEMIRNIFTSFNPSEIWTTDIGASPADIMVTIGCIACLEAYQYYQRNTAGVLAWLQSSNRPVRWAVYYGALLLLYFLGDVRPQQFIYFQF